MKKSSSGSTVLPLAEEFGQWVAETTGLEGRSLRDVLSRARRVRTILDLTNAHSVAEVDYRLAKCPDFAALTPSAQSQLRRAARLYCRFKGGGRR